MSILFLFFAFAAFLAYAHASKLVICSIDENGIRYYYPCKTNNTYISENMADKWPNEGDNSTTVILSVVAALLGTGLIFCIRTYFTYSNKKIAEHKAQVTTGRPRNPIPRR